MGRNLHGKQTLKVKKTIFTALTLLFLFSPLFADRFLDHQIPDNLKLILDENLINEDTPIYGDSQEELSEEEEPVITELPLSILNETNRNHPLVIKHRNQYLSEKWLKWLRQVLEDSMEYRLYVRKVIEEMGLPPELEYLPVVESNYKTSAKSKSGALGMWQFMENSVKPFLQLDEFVFDLECESGWRWIRLYECSI